MKLFSSLKQGGLLSGIVGVLMMVGLTNFGVTQEVPVGRLQGSVLMKENGKPLVHAQVILTYVQSETETARYDLPVSNWHTRTDAAGNFSLNGLPAGDFTVGIYGKSHTSASSSATVVEGKLTTQSFEADPSVPNIEMNSGSRVFTPAENPEFQLTGVSIVPTASVKAWYLDRNQDTDSTVFPKIAQAIQNQKEPFKNPFKEVHLTLVQEKDIPLKNRDLEGTFAETWHLGNLKEGQYLVQAACGKDLRTAWILVTKLAAIVKNDGKRMAVFVTDITTGVPVPQATVSMVNLNGKLELGKTNAQGLLDGLMPRIDSKVGYVVAESNGSLATCLVRAGSRERTNRTLWIQTDRPVYRPGDTVQYKLTARDLIQTNQQVPVAQEVSFAIQDPNDAEISKSRATLSKMGTAWGSFIIPADGDPGGYTIQARVGKSSTTKYVSIMAYRKADFKITVTPERAVVLRGEKLTFKIQATSYTGEPLVGTAVTASIYRNGEGDIWSPGPKAWESGDDSYAPSPYEGDHLQDIKGVTDAAGQCLVSVDTEAFKGLGANLEDATYSAIASVTSGGRIFEATGAARVARGEYDLTAEFDRQIANPGDTATLSVNAISEPGAATPRDQIANIRVVREVFQGNVMTELDPQTFTLPLTAGKGTTTFRPNVAGDYVATIATIDSKGRQVNTTAHLWVPSNSIDTTPAAKFGVKLDKKKYASTDHAFAYLESKQLGGEALVTVEGNGLHEVRTVPLTAHSIKLTIDHLDKYLPGVTLVVTTVSHKQFLESSASIRIDVEEKQLDLTIHPDRSVVLPNGQVTYKIEASDQQGNPVVADLALGIVDESIFAIAPDNDQPIRDFYAFEYSQVDTNYSFAEVYLDGENKSPVAREIRKNFQDTAYWNPKVTTNDQGIAEVTVKLPDNLTSWRMTATAFTADTKIGRASVNVVARKDLMARLSLPQYLVQGDEVQISASLTNSTNRPLEVEYDLSTIGVKVTQGSAKNKVTLAANSSQALNWMVLAEQPGRSSITLKATSATLNDGVLQSFPLIVHGARLTLGFAGRLTATQPDNVRFDLPGTSAEGNVNLTFSSSIVGVYLNALPSLIDDQFECTEQTMNRIVPGLVIANALTKTDQLSAGLKASLEEAEKKSRRRLKVLQHSDGGFGWWEFDQSNAYMTALFLDGAYRLHQIGHDLPSGDVASAVKWSNLELKKPTPAVSPTYQDEMEARARLAVAILAVDPKNPIARAEVDADLARGTGAFAIEAVCLAYERMTGDAVAARQAKKSYQILLGRMDDGSGAIRVKGTSWSDPTAEALEPVARMESKPDRSAKILNYLLARRRGDAWTSTLDTARVLFGGAVMLAQSPEGITNSTIDFRINGSSNTVDLGSGLHQFTSITLPVSTLLAGHNSIELKCHGAPVYYGVSISARPFESHPVATKSPTGIILKREYFKMQAVPREDGTSALVPATQSSTSFKTGDIFRCRLTVEFPVGTRYLMVEDPAPSNCRIVDTDQLTDGRWAFWWAKSIFRDDRANFFFDVSDRKPQVIEYAVRAEQLGKSVALPAQVWEMYRPDNRASTDAVTIEVTK